MGAGVLGKAGLVAAAALAPAAVYKYTFADPALKALEQSRVNAKEARSFKYIYYNRLNYLFSDKQIDEMARKKFPGVGGYDALSPIQQSKLWDAHKSSINQARKQNGLPGFAQGGIVTRPTLAMVGEKGPELILPLNRGLGSITFAPVITINGSGSNVRGQVEAGINSGLEEFKRNLREVLRQERRTAYAG